MLDIGTDQGRAMLDAIVTQQATMIAYDNDFKLLMVLTLVSLPLVLVIGSSHAPAARRSHAMDARSAAPKPTTRMDSQRDA